MQIQGNQFNPNSQNNKLKYLIITVAVLAFLTAAMIILFLILFISRNNNNSYDSNDPLLEVETMEKTPVTATAPVLSSTIDTQNVETTAPETGISYKYSQITEIVTVKNKTTTKNKKTTVTTAKTTKKKKKTTTTTKFKSYLVDVKSYVPIYDAPGYENNVAEYITELTKYTIVDERWLSNSEYDHWGKLKSGAGWINLYDAQNPYYGGGIDDDGLGDGMDSYNAYINGNPYFYADMNGDGSDELFVKTGDCEANYMWNVYTLEGGSVKYVGDFNGGHGNIVICETGEFYYLFTHMGWTFLAQIEMNGTDSITFNDQIFPGKEDMDFAYYDEIIAFLENKGIVDYEINY